MPPHNVSDTDNANYESQRGDWRAVLEVLGIPGSKAFPTVYHRIECQGDEWMTKMDLISLLKMSEDIWRGQAT